MPRTVRSIAASWCALAVACTGETPEEIRPPEGASSRFELTAVGDWDGDGTPDLALGLPDDERGGHAAGCVRVVSGADRRILFERVGAADSERLGRVLVPAGDLNGDGRLDLLAASRPKDRNGALVQALSGEDGSTLFGFELAALPEPWERGLVEPAGDADGDGKGDVVVFELVPDPARTARTGRLVVRSGADGEALWAVEVSSSGEPLRAPVGTAGDVDGDGRADVFARAASFEVVVFSGKDGAELRRWPGSARNACGLGDVDGDGHDDLAIARLGESTNGGWPPDEIRVHSGLTGDVLWIARDDLQTRFTELGESLRSAGDLDGDGVLDLLAGAPCHDGGLDDEDSGRLLLFSGATGELLWSVLGRIGSKLGADVRVLGDLDGDGRLEVAATAFEWSPGEDPVRLWRVHSVGLPRSAHSPLRSR